MDLISIIFQASVISFEFGKMSLIVLLLNHQILYRHSHLKEVALDKRHLYDASCGVPFGVAGYREHPVAI
jgi:hypothetical protein